MDYTPSPAKINKEFAFLDNSIDTGVRSGRTRGSPLKPTRDDSLNNLQKRFFDKYSGFKPAKGRTELVDEQTTDRLFKVVPQRVPVDDGVKISSNMIEKIIRENESLQRQVSKLKQERDVTQTFAKGLKDKLIKYRQSNERLTGELERLERLHSAKEDEILALRVKNEQLESELELKATVESPIASAPASIFPQETSKAQEPAHKAGATASEVEELASKVEEPVKVQEPVKMQEPVTVQEPVTKVQEPASEVEERIKALQSQIIQISEKDTERFQYIKHEIDSLRDILLNPREDSSEAPAPEPNGRISEDDWIIRETDEVEQLQQEVLRIQRKLQIREDNLRRKTELKEQLRELSSQLDNQSACATTTTNHSLPPKTSCTVCPGSTDKESSEAPHFHINGTKWY